MDGAFHIALDLNMPARKPKYNLPSLVRVPKRLLRSDLERRLPLRLERFLDLTGKKLSRCQIIGLAGFIRGYTVWLCRCKCGQLYLARTNALLHRVSSCGCTRERHGDSGSPEHRIWHGIRSYYAHEVCPRWSSYHHFLTEVGRRPKRTFVLGRLDRLVPFQPGNVKWMPKRDAKLNYKMTRYTYGGETLSHREWADRIGISFERLRQRIAKCNKYGASLDEAIATPAGERMPCTRGRGGRPKKVAIK